jgi:hypothetical protein
VIISAISRYLKANIKCPVKYREKVIELKIVMIRNILLAQSSLG